MKAPRTFFELGRESISLALLEERSSTGVGFVSWLRELGRGEDKDIFGLCLFGGLRGYGCFFFFLGIVFLNLLKKSKVKAKDEP